MFIFMKTYHSAKFCRPDFNCFKCDERHHVAVSTFDNQKRSTNGSLTCGSSNLNLFCTNNILLQSIRSTVYSVNKNYSTDLHLLLNSGS